jgi:hypothetical protein
MIYVRNEARPHLILICLHFLGLLESTFNCISYDFFICIIYIFIIQTGKKKKPLKRPNQIGIFLLFFILKKSCTFAAEIKMVDIFPMPMAKTKLKSLGFVNSLTSVFKMDFNKETRK